MNHNSNITNDTGDYQGTPSFYNSQEVFERFLAHTAYYKALQDALSKTVALTQPEHILELGSGTGATACRVASEHPGAHITGIDTRSNMVASGRELARSRQLENIRFEEAELLEFVNKRETLPECVYMLYVFHHIPDPPEKKIEFLKTCRSKLPPNGYLCIADVFIPDIPNNAERESRLMHNWSMRMMEAYTGVFWSALENLSPDGVAHAREAGRYSMKKEQEAGDLVIRRQEEYMVSTQWLEEASHKAGFTVCINEPVNTVGDAIVVLRRENG